MPSPLPSILQALFPSACACCGRVLALGERQLCTHCLSDLALACFSAHPDNPAERRLAHLPGLQAATALCLFEAGGTARRVVHAMKFRSCTELCLLMGRQMGLDLTASHRFDGVDLLLPVPLHWLRRLHRGYNQSELLCRGIASVMPRPVVVGALVRHRYTRQQSLRRGDRRAANVEGAFSLRHAERLEGKHVLLVDDVLTTGATLTACCDALLSVPGIRISVATFSLTR